MQPGAFRLTGCEVGWEKWTPKSDKLERRRCQDEEGPVDVQRLCQGNGPAIMSVVAVSSQ